MTSRTREILEDLESVRENLLALCANLWQWVATCTWRRIRPPIGSATFCVACWSRSTFQSSQSSKYTSTCAKTETRGELTRST